MEWYSWGPVAAAGYGHARHARARHGGPHASLVAGALLLSEVWERGEGCIADATAGGCGLQVQRRAAEVIASARRWERSMGRKEGREARRGEVLPAPVGASSAGGRPSMSPAAPREAAPARLPAATTAWLVVCRVAAEARATAVEVAARAAWAAVRMVVATRAPTVTVSRIIGACGAVDAAGSGRAGSRRERVGTA